MVWSCHPLLQLNHSVQKTEAQKVADLRMTILMQNWKLHSRSFVFSCSMGLRMVIQKDVFVMKPDYEGECHFLYKNSYN